MSAISQELFAIFKVMMVGHTGCQQSTRLYRMTILRCDDSHLPLLDNNGLGN